MSSLATLDPSNIRENLRHLALSQKPHWADERIRAWDENRFSALEPFATSHYWMHSGSINVFRIVGTDCPDYQGRTWAWFIQHGKRMPANLALHRENREYYLDDAHKHPTMSFISMDGHDWYVHRDGNHRTCIARFDFHFSGLTELRGVSLYDWRFDLDLYQAWQNLQAIVLDRRLPLSLETRRQTLEREDNPGWMRERYRPAIQATAPRWRGLLDADAARRLIEHLEGPWYRRWFRAWPKPERQESD